MRRLCGKSLETSRSKGYFFPFYFLQSALYLLYTVSMLTIVKVIFFFVAGIFLVTHLNSAGFGNGPLSTTRNDSSSELSDREAYSRAYDTNGNGIVDDEEYRQGEIHRIAEEVEVLEDATLRALEEHNESPYADHVQLSASNARDDEHETEYVAISYRGGSDDPSINITGWRLESLVTERGGTIGRGVPLLEGNRPRTNATDIFLAPGEDAIISTDNAVGIGTSFLTNECMGYFRSDRFYPTVGGSCPLLRDVDLKQHGLSFNDFRREREYDACMDEIENIYSCEIVRSADRSLTDQCEDFIEDYSNYDGCVELNKFDEDFYGDEWRIFLGSNRELWREEREAIALYDREGRLVDLVRY
jgi:hypothetical protein